MIDIPVTTAWVLVVAIPTIAIAFVVTVDNTFRIISLYWDRKDRRSAK